MTIKELRKQKKLTQVEASEITGIPLRTYKLYENDESRVGSIKYDYIIDKLSKYGYVDETHGILALEDIEKGISEVLSEYSVDFLTIPRLPSVDLSSIHKTFLVFLSVFPFVR